ncbi:MAG: hypothetical protein PUB52_06355 [Lachnospiraceae bacterium]|nr:hypothetical protein [Lachnospiraceae bacterium]
MKCYNKINHSNPEVIEMDFQQQPNYNNYSYQVPPTRRNMAMEAAALVLGIISIASGCCLYSALICGALAAILALLSRGGEKTMSRRAMIGFWLGISGIIITIVLYVFTYFAAIEMYGSLENVLRAYCDMYGLDYESLYGDMPLLQ